MTTVTSYVGSSTDDSYQPGQNTAGQPNQAHVVLASGHTGGWRFHPAIPAGSVASSAYLVCYFPAYVEFKGSYTVYDNIYVRIHGEKSTASAAFGFGTNDIYGRTRSNAYSDWSKSTNLPTTVTAYQSVNFSSVITELCAQAGWGTGSPVTLIGDCFDNGGPYVNDPRCHSYDGGYQSYIQVTYTTPSTPTVTQDTADAASLSTSPTLLATGNNADGNNVYLSWELARNSDGVLVDTELTGPLGAGAQHSYTTEIAPLTKDTVYKWRVRPTSYAGPVGDWSGWRTFTAGATSYAFPSPISSAEAFGNPTRLASRILSAVGAIASAEAFGTAKINRTVSAVGAIASAQAFGTPNMLVSTLVQPAGIASGEAHGAGIIIPGSTSVLPPSIATEEAHGLALVNQRLFGAGGISSPAPLAVDTFSRSTRAEILDHPTYGRVLALPGGTDNAQANAGGQFRTDVRAFASGTFTARMVGARGASTATEYLFDAFGSAEGFALRLLQTTVRMNMLLGYGTSNVSINSAQIPGNMPVGEMIGLGVDFDIDAAGNYDITFYYSTDEGENWIELSNHTGALPAPLVAVGTAASPGIGGPSATWEGFVKWADFNVNGTLANPDFTAQPVGTLTFLDDYGNTWNVIRANESLGSTEAIEGAPAIPWVYDDVGVYNYKAKPSSLATSRFNLGSADGIITSPIDYLGTENIGLLFRSDAVLEPYLRAYMQPLGLRIAKIEAGVATVLASNLNWIPVVGTKYNMAVDLAGNQIDVYINGVLLLSHTLVGADIATFAGRTYVGLYASAASQSTWDYIRVNDPFGMVATKEVQSVAPEGVASAEALGHPVVVPGAASVLPGGVASEEAWGVVVLQAINYAAPASIPSEEAHGLAQVNLRLLLDAIASAEEFGVPVVVPGPWTISDVGGIASQEAVGQPTLHYYATVLPSGIVSVEAFGVPDVLPGSVTLVVPGISSEEAFGNPEIQRIKYYVKYGDKVGNIILSKFPSTTVADPAPNLILLAPGEDNLLLED